RRCCISSMTELGRRGLLITFEGVEGCGKTTQLRLLHRRLEANGLRAVENTTAIGAQIRRIMLDRHNREITALTELMLMVAAQAQAAAEIIVPALERADIVLSDRFTDSTLAYQGEARGLGFATVRAAQRLALGSLAPDLTICILIDIETGLRRAACRNQDASEARIDESEPARFRIIDGAGEPAQVAERVWAEVRRLLADNKD